MKKRTISSIVVALVLAGSGLGAAPAQAASIARCEPGATYDIDAYGYLNFHPRATCYGGTNTIAIYAFNVSQTTHILYKNKPSGIYSGIGISIPYSGHKTYCIVVDIAWSSAFGNITDDASSRNCVVR